MADQRDGGISWTDDTWNPIRGCSRVSEGCRHCYAEREANRHAGPGGAYEGLVRGTRDGPRWTGEVRLIEERLADPIRWQRPRRIFVNSMSDLFHEALDGPTIARIFAVMSLAPQHVFQVLTKRAERMSWVLEDVAFAHEVNLLRQELAPRSGDMPTWPLPNVWLGTSVEDQAAADKRISEILKTPAAVRWLSLEPLLGPVNLRLRGQVPACDDCSVGVMDARNPHVGGSCRCECHGPRLDWLVIGGESGPGARPMALEWATSLLDQAAAAGVPAWFKQTGSVLAAELGLVDKKGAQLTGVPEELRVREMPRTREVAHAL